MLNLLKKNFVIFSFIGILALSLLIWFAGPFFVVAFGDSLNRWFTILLLWLVWLSIILWLYFLERKNSKAMANNIVSSADEEIASLKENFKNALQALQQQFTTGDLTHGVTSNWMFDKRLTAMSRGRR